MASAPARQIGFFDTTMAVMGGIVGAGIFMNPQVVAQRVDRPALALGAWIAGGLVALAGAYVYAELAARRPRVGGQYVFLRDAIHPLAAFLYGWGLLLVIQSGAMAAVAVTFARYANELLPRPLDETTLAVAALVVLMAVNCAGVRIGSRVQSVLMAIKVGAIAAFVLVGLFAFPGASAPVAVTPSPISSLPSELSWLPSIIAFGTAMVPVMFAYGGWQTTTFLAGEMKDASRMLPRALLVGVIGVVVLYLAVNVACLLTLGFEGLRETPAPASTILRRALGPIGGTLIAAAIAISTLGWLSHGVLTAPRLYFAMAQDGVFFEAIGRVDARTGAPVAAIALQVGLAIVVTLSGRYEQILNYVMSVDAVAMGLTALCVFGLRRRDRAASAAAPSFTTPGHPLTTLFFTTAYWLVAVSTIVRSPRDSLMGLGILSLGVPAFFLWRRAATARRHVVAGLIAAAVSAASAANAIAQDSPTPTETSPIGVPKFAIAPSPIGLRGDVRPRQYLGVVGRKAAWLGVETGEAELWVHPLKLATRFRLDFRIPDYVEPIHGADVARRVEVRPEITTITYSHATFTVRQHILVPLDEPGILVLLDVDTVRPLEIVASFRSVFQYAWPGALGGQYTTWNASERAFLLSESRRQHNAYIGSPLTVSASDHPAHALPDAPSTFAIAIDRARTSRELVPIAIAAGIGPLAEVLAVYRRLLTRAQALYDARRAHAERLRTELLSIDTPDDSLDLAFEWAKVNLDEQMVCNPDLGCGLVAGWGASGESARPGFGWFFGGDAAINSFAMSAAGMTADVEAGLRFLAKYQRADGKLPHEISQAAGRLAWFTDFPYAYYHADTTPYWIVAVWRAWKASGHDAFVTEMWPALQKAWTWCLSTETDGDGLIENTSGGLGAIEVGAIGEDIHEDIYLAGVWVQAIAAMREMATARRAPEADAAATLEPKALRTLNERYWMAGAGHHAFGILRSGRTNDTLTVWPATAAAFGLFEPARGRQTLRALAGHAITTDWGARMLSAASPLYEPLHYNMGAVWPFVTGFVALGHYQYQRPWAGYPLIDALAHLTFDFARGRHAELLSGRYYRPLDTAVPHQFFATSMLVSPIVSGLFGWTPDAPQRRARLAPQLPPHWERVVLRRLRVGDTSIDVTIEQRPGRIAIQQTVTGSPVRLELAPVLPPGAVVKTRTPSLVSWTGGLSVVAPVARLAPGDTSSGLRIVDVSWDGVAGAIEVEGEPGRSYEIALVGDVPASAERASISRTSAERATLRITLPDASTAFVRATIRLSSGPQPR
jgi:amino acid transporter